MPFDVTTILGRTVRIEFMRWHRATRVLTSWIALAAFLVAVLAPSVSHALGTKGEDSWIEVCTMAGSKWVQPEDPLIDHAPLSGNAHAFEHCPYCSHHANAILVPGVPAVLAPALSLSELQPTAFLVAPHTLFAWVTAQPRAPPPFS